MNKKITFLHIAEILFFSYSKQIYFLERTVSQTATFLGEE